MWTSIKTLYSIRTCPGSFFLRNCNCNFLLEFDLPLSLWKNDQAWILGRIMKPIGTHCQKIGTYSAVPIWHLEIWFSSIICFSDPHRLLAFIKNCQNEGKHFVCFLKNTMLELDVSWVELPIIDQPPVTRMRI
jgi:hypothetical protein